MRSIFISDLHLDEQRPQITALFLHFLGEGAKGADRLYILGDLFESWIGDDHITDLGETVALALKRLSHTVAIYFMHGNRDFLLGQSYAEKAGVTLLEDPTIIGLGDLPALITHGDSLCTDDEHYQQIRAELRDPEWQRQFLAQSIDQRLSFAEQARAESSAYTSQASSTIMDVNAVAVEKAMTAANVSCLVHGHTHRPDLHDFILEGKTARRLVLGDWYEQGNYALHQGQRLELRAIPLT